jgi:hypothetical protein
MLVEEPSPLPLIHVPDRKILTKYAPQTFHDKTGTPEGPRNVSAPIHTQLLLNYCLGHDKSTMLLCPYGINTALINHNHTHPNVELHWSTKHSRHLEWLQQPIEEWAPTSTAAGLVMDLVALRDIAEGEEILLDYGRDWEQAWQSHVAQWKPPPRASRYQPAHILERQSVIRTMETDGFYYDSHSVALLCRYSLLKSGFGLVLDYLEVDNDEEYETKEQFVHCRALQRHPVMKARGDKPSSLSWVPTNDEGNYRGIYTYTIEVYAQAYDNRNKVCAEPAMARLWNVPRDVFAFEDLWYTRDHAQPWSFRHAMGIPEHLMPEAWKNLEE